MKIAKYIGELIYDYECVIIPGFGGFISTEKSAIVNQLTNQFAPPSKDVHFNVHLKANDGLLINYVAQNESITFKEAKQKIEHFVQLCQQALKEDKKINISNIGYIFNDEQQNIVFIQDKSINYNADAFGLSTFVSPVIQRPNSEEKIKEAFSKKTVVTGNKKRKDKRAPLEAGGLERTIIRRKSFVKGSLVFVLLILFAFASYFTISNRNEMLHYWDTHKAKIPLLYSNPGDYLAANAENLPLEKIIVNQASWISSLFDFNKKPTVYKIANYKNSDYQNEDLIVETVENTPVVVQTEVEISESKLNGSAEPKIENQPVKEKLPDLSTKTQNNIFIIAGSFKSELNAKRLVTELKQQGYGAELAGTNLTGLFRVAYMGFTSMSDAKNSLIAVRKASNPQAWILKK